MSAEVPPRSARPENMPSKFMDAAHGAVLAAAAVCRSVQREQVALRAITKDDRSPVTIADFASQAVVFHTLSQRLGRDFDFHRFVAEEDASALRKPENQATLDATLDAARQIWPALDASTLLDLIDRGLGTPSADGFWTLDPIDGTKGFLRGQQYAVALAWVQQGVPRIGALACPNLPLDPSKPLDRADAQGSLYLAEQGHGAEELPCVADSSMPRRALERLEPIPPGSLRICASVDSGHTNVDHTDRVLARLGERFEMIRVDSSAKYALVARGQADAYLRLPTRKDYVERIWDHAAGAVLAAESGIVVSDIFGHDLDFGVGRGLENNQGVIVARAGAHARIISALRELKSS